MRPAECHNPLNDIIYDAQIDFTGKGGFDQSLQNGKQIFKAVTTLLCDTFCRRLGQLHLGDVDVKPHEAGGSIAAVQDHSCAIVDPPNGAIITDDPELMVDQRAVFQRTSGNFLNLAQIIWMN
ncbi:hypothetical protein ATB93_16925 [Sphingomonas sp. WG]|nr:hypothetical protein ATB93_16925 [Sphingomonas sp. WG]